MESNERRINFERNKWALQLIVEGIMKNKAYLKAEMFESGDEFQPYEVEILAGGDILDVITLLREILVDTSESMEVSSDKIVAAIAEKNQELFESRMSDLLEEHVKNKLTGKEKIK